MRVLTILMQNLALVVKSMPAMHLPQDPAAMTPSHPNT